MVLQSYKDTMVEGFFCFVFFTRASGLCHEFACSFRHCLFVALTF